MWRVISKSQIDTIRFTHVIILLRLQLTKRLNARCFTRNTSRHLTDVHFPNTQNNNNLLCTHVVSMKQRLGGHGRGFGLRVAGTRYPVLESGYGAKLLVPRRPGGTVDVHARSNGDVRVLVNDHGELRRRRRHDWRQWRRLNGRSADRRLSVPVRVFVLRVVLGLRPFGRHVGARRRLLRTVQAGHDFRWRFLFRRIAGRQYGRRVQTCHALFHYHVLQVHGNGIRITSLPLGTAARRRGDFFRRFFRFLLLFFFFFRVRTIRLGNYLLLFRAFSRLRRFVFGIVNA